MAKKDRLHKYCDSYKLFLHRYIKQNQLAMAGFVFYNDAAQ